MTRPRAAIVGAGLMGFWHARALTRAGAELALSVDRDADRAKVLAARFAGCHTAPDLSDLGAQGITAVHICTPTPSHAALIEQALEAGCHVLVEKPLADDAATTRRLVELAAARNVIMCPVHQVLFQRGMQELLAWLDGDEPLHVDLVMCSAGAERTHADAALVAEILPHPLSFLARVLPRALDVGVWNVARSCPGEFRASLAADATASILISTHGRPTVNAARVIARRGTAHLDFFHGFAVVQGSAVSRTRKALQPFEVSSRIAIAAALNLLRRAALRQTAYPGLWELVASFYRQLQSGGHSPIPAADIETVAALRDRLC